LSKVDFFNSPFIRVLALSRSYSSRQNDNRLNHNHRICDPQLAAWSLRKNIPQPALQGHFGWAFAGGFKPVVEISYLHMMLDFGLSDAHQDAGGKSEIAPFIFVEDTEGLGDAFEDALSANLDRMLDALRIVAEDLASTDGHDPKLSFSYFLRHQA
jgi:hypothetical protein